MLYKYRIVETKDCNGHLTYTVERKTMFKWVSTGLGYFDSKEEARDAFKTKAEEIFLKNEYDKHKVVVQTFTSDVLVLVKPRSYHF